MWIVSPFAPVEVDWIAAFKWRRQALARFVMWNGKRLPLVTWCEKWRQSGWIQHLVGQMCEPSTANSGVDLWIASLRDTHANRSQQPENVVDTAILDTYGPKLPVLLAKFHRALYFS